MSHEAHAIDVHHLSKSFGDIKAVDDVSIQVPRGKIYGFLGPNGSGKTTTIRLICGLLTADQGRGVCLGFDILSQSDQIRQRTGYMTQKFSYWEDMTVLENMIFVADMYNLSNPSQRIEDVIRTLQLETYRDKLAGTLSGGWKQRLALACSILHKPKLLLLDEPTAGIDPKARREFWDEIHKLASEGITVLVSTHYMDEVERCHAIIFISKGKVITQGTPEEVVAEAGLTTWLVRGKNLIALQEELETLPPVSSVAPFGDSLHVSGTDAKALSKATASYRKDKAYHWQLAESSMEDVFIQYTQQAREENKA